MSLNRASYRVFALLTVLVFASVSSQAQAVHQPVHRLQAVAVFGDGGARIWRFLASLLPEGTRKEGMTIDPNGAPNHQGAATSPTSSFTDEGMSIDPNGRH
jgi:hypothetical protein